MATTRVEKRSAAAKAGQAKGKQTQPAAANPFWDFSLEAYARDGAAQACLALQDSRGFDVNLLLFCCWAGAQGRRLETGELESLIATVLPWRGKVVEPLRAVRRHLRSGAGEEGDDIPALLARVKDAELEAEAVQQRILFEALPIQPGEASAKTAAGNLKSYTQVMRIECDSAVTADLAAVLRGAFPLLAPLEAVWTLI